ncbi:EF-hand domain-containing protein [Vreelandella sedimenti]|uniref:EF-hand domain-containing protein n=1 Tax=Vreelandella sedimenti TaxID=2729618 RepID=UPI00257A8DF5|nr:EF-hand domain-containing protein [Halomonas sp. UBA3173]
MAQQYKTGLIITGDASGGIRAIKATDDELGKLNKGFDKGSRQSKKFGNDAERAGRQLTEIDRGAGVATRGIETLRRAAAPIAGVIAGMFAANTIQNQIDWGDQLQKTNLRIGASTESLSQYNYVAKLSGVEFGQLTTAWQRQTRRIAEAAAGTGVASKALDQLGLSAKELNQLAPEEQFERIATAMQNVESSSERVALAQKLWDSEGVKLVQIVNQGTDAIASMRAEADALGLTITQDTANAMATYNDEVDKLKFAAQGLSQTLASELVPSMTAGMQATSAFIQDVGGAEAILNTAKDAALLLAAIMAGRYAAAFAIGTKRIAANIAATIAQTRADAAATTAARVKAAETLRVAQADQAAASRALANGHAIAAATGNTTLRTKAITQMAAANQRAIAAEAGHTAAIGANTAAMQRHTVSAYAMAAATRAGSAALALVGGPAGAAMIAGAAAYYFRDSLGFASAAARETREEIDQLVESMDNYTEAQYRNNRVSIVQDLAEARVEAEKLERQIAALQEQSQQESIIYQGRPGAASGQLSELMGELQEQRRIVAANERGLREYDQTWQDVLQSQVSGVSIFRTLDQWLDEIGRSADSAGNSVNSGAPSNETITAWEKYNEKLRDSLAASRDPSAVGAANRELDTMGVIDPVRRAITVGLALQEDQGKRQKELQREAADAAKQAASEAERAYQQQARAAEQSAKQQADALLSIQQEMDPLLVEHDKYIERIGVLDQALSDGTLAPEAYGDAFRWVAEQFTRARTGADDYEKQTESLINTYDSHNQKAHQLRDALEQINQRWRDDPANGDQYARMVAGVRDEMAELALESDPMAQEMARAWEEAANRIDETFADAFTGAFDSFDDFGDQLLDSFKRLLGELAYQATLKPIVVNFTGQMQGMLGMGGGGSIPGLGSGAGGFDVSSIGSLGKTVSGWFGGGAAAAGGATAGYTGALGAATSTGYGGALGSAVSGAANPGMFASMGGLSGIAGGLGAGYAGMQLGSQLAPDAKYGDVAGGLGAVGGFMLDGPLGSAIGGAIGASISKGLFGGNWETKDGGLQLGVSAGDITGNQYERQRKSGGLFSGSSYRTKTSDLDSEFEAALSQTYQAQELALRASLDTLGQQSSALNSFSAGLEQISTKGKSDEEVEQAVQDWLQGVVNKAAQSVVDPAEYALAGETTVETLNRLATALTGVNPLLDVMHGFMYDASLAGGDMAAQLASMSGGMEQFTQRANYYWENIATETERHDAAMRQAANAMGAFTARTGEIITTTDQLRTLVDGIDLSSEAGRELYAAAMQLAPALVEVENGLERVKDRFADLLSEAESALGSAEQQARSAWQAFSNQSFGQQITLLESVGDSQAALALQRERELQGIDPLLHETQRFIWAMEDEAAAKQNATQAAQNYRREIERVRNELSNTLGNISGWIDQRNATSQTPGLNLEAAGEQFARQLVLAESGDRNALQSITQYADSYLAAGEAMFASGGAFQSIQNDVLSALQGLPDQISAEQFLADEIKIALREQTQGISTRLGDVLRGDNPSSIAGNLAGYFETLAGGIDGVLTPEQLAIVMSGKATDAELAAIMRAVDLNGDGVMNGLESVIIAGMPTDSILGTVLRNKMNELDKNQLTSAQVRNALSPIATDAEISRLIREVDVNGDGIISKQELTNARVGGLASGIAKSLNPAFNRLDRNLDNLIDYGEFSNAFAGMASDDELRRIFNKLDADGSGTISRLEALNQSNEGTEDNTKTLEERARDQLSSLNGLVGEMARTTDQFVGLNSTMVSLQDSINALGVAQKEVARIERERAAAEKAERERIEREREEGVRLENLSALGDKINAVYGDMSSAEYGIARAAGGLSSAQETNIQDRLLEFTGEDERLSHSEMMGFINGVVEAENWSGSREAYGKRIAQQLRRASRIDEYEEQAASLRGDDYSNGMNAESTARDFDVTSDMSRAESYLYRYPDVAQNWSGSAEEHYRKIGQYEGRHFANGGYTGPGGKYELAGHVHAGEVVWSQDDIARFGGVGAVESLRTGSRQLPLPDMPLPQFPALSNNDVLQVLQDVKRELVESRKENKRLQEENNRHAEASVAVQQAGFNGQISEAKKSNQSLDDMSAAARLEASR